jgi:hypothetical protein
MKRKKTPARTRNTLAKRLRNCSTQEERWFLLHTGTTRPTELEQLFYLVLEERNAERYSRSYDPNLDVTKSFYARWRTSLEQRTGKLILPLLMKGNANAIRDLAHAVENMEKLNADYPPECDFLRRALLKLFRHRVSPWDTTWQELEAKLVELHAGGHDRNHIRRVMKQLGIWKLIQIPTKRKRKP